MSYGSTTWRGVNAEGAENQDLGCGASSNSLSAASCPPCIAWRSTVLLGPASGSDTAWAGTAGLD